jgi:glyoxylase-like metal-dependent hydrolase (beta-lactamase superfamily II)
VGAVQLMDHVWLVGGVGITDDYDCHCYLIADDAGGLLIDAGTGRASAAWHGAVAEVCDPSTVSGVVITHYHADHAGGAADATVPVIASLPTAEALAVADEARTSLARARDAGVYPPEYRLRPAVVDRVVSGGERLTAGNLPVEILAAPGHSDGHLVVLASVAGRRLLFSGDCLFAGGRVSIQALPDCRLDRYAETVIALAGLDIDVLLPGHGDPVLGDAATGIERAAASFRRLIPPPNVLQVVSPGLTV